jgi:hypothetical protein
LRSVSDSRRYGKSYFSANRLLRATLSTLTPRMTAPACSNAPERSRNPQPSAVQPGVSAAG